MQKCLALADTTSIRIQEPGRFCSSRNARAETSCTPAKARNGTPAQSVLYWGQTVFSLALSLALSLAPQEPQHRTCADARGPLGVHLLAHQLLPVRRNRKRIRCRLGLKGGGIHTTNRARTVVLPTGMTTWRCADVTEDKSVMCSKHNGAQARLYHLRIVSMYCIAHGTVKGEAFSPRHVHLMPVLHHCTVLHTRKVYKTVRDCSGPCGRGR